MDAGADASPRSSAGAGGGAAAADSQMTGMRQEVLQQTQQQVSVATTRPASATSDALTTTTSPIAHEAELAELSSRIETLQASGLLQEEEAFTLFDTISDFLDVQARLAPQAVTLERLRDCALLQLGDSSAGGARVSRVCESVRVCEVLHRMLVQSAGLRSDAVFARTLRRKFL